MICNNSGIAPYRVWYVHDLLQLSISDCCSLIISIYVWVKNPQKLQNLYIWLTGWLYNGAKLLKLVKSSGVDDINYPLFSNIIPALVRYRNLVQDSWNHHINTNMTVYRARLGYYNILKMSIYHKLYRQNHIDHHIVSIWWYDLAQRNLHPCLL